MGRGEGGGGGEWVREIVWIYVRKYSVSCRSVCACERKDTRPSPAFPYCKRWKAGRGLGMRLSVLLECYACC